MEQEVLRRMAELWLQEDRMKVVVHGATGAQGGPVFEALKAAGHEVRGLCRGAREDATWVQADLMDVGSLKAAYVGADAVFLHLPIPSDPAVVGTWAGHVVQALRGSGVRRVVYSTSGSPVHAAGPHPMMQARQAGTAALVQALEQAVDEVVVLAPRLFLENLLLPFVHGPVLEAGVLAYPLAADKKISWVSHQDVAKAAVVALTLDGVEGVFDLGLPGMTGPELAREIGAALGRSVRYEALTPDAFAARATPLFGADAAGGIGALYDAFADDPTLEVAAEARRVPNATVLGVKAWAQRFFMA